MNIIGIEYIEYIVHTTHCYTSVINVLQIDLSKVL